MNARARGVLTAAIEARVFPAAALEVGSSAGALWTDAVGRLTFEPDAPPALPHTLFDLASLTKVVATTSVAMDLIARGRLTLEEPLLAHFDDWRGTDRECVTLRDLLEHASGLPARLVDAPPETRREFEHEISTIKLEYPPRTRSVYSDLDFILVGFLLEDAGGARLPVLTRSALGETDLTFNPGVDLAKWAAPTQPLREDVRRGRLLAGQVHDSYAAALGGAAGHAGLFGTAPAAGAFARVLLRAARGDTRTPSPFTPALVRLFTTKSTVPGSSRALGWDTMLPTSSCGTKMSDSAFGHVGFTGTSLWIDPARDRYFVLLTNRAYGDASTEAMQRVRREFHDAFGDL